MHFGPKCVESHSFRRGSCTGKEAESSPQARETVLYLGDDCSWSDADGIGSAPPWRAVQAANHQMSKLVLTLYRISAGSAISNVSIAK